jgi:hypothetical protein
MHVNSTIGLCAPTVTLDDGGEYQASKVQLWLYQCWQDTLARVRKLRKRGDRVYGVFDGDGPDGNWHSAVQLITTNPQAIVSAFIDVARPMRELCHDGFWMVRGTEAHVGPSAYLEETAAELLQATKYPADGDRFTCWQLKLRLQGVSFDIMHHGRMGNLPWTKANALGTQAYQLVDAYIRNGEMPPTVGVRAHRHRWADTGANYPVRMIALPCWQLATAYVHKVAPASPADIGAVICVIEDGRLQVEPVLYRPQTEAAWEPTQASASPSRRRTYSKQS